LRAHKEAKESLRKAAKAYDIKAYDILARRSEKIRTVQDAVE